MCKEEDRFEAKAMPPSVSVGSESATLSQEGPLCISRSRNWILAHTTILGLPRKEVQQRC